MNVDDIIEMMGTEMKITSVTAVDEFTEEAVFSVLTQKTTSGIVEIALMVEQLPAPLYSLLHSTGSYGPVLEARVSVQGRDEPIVFVLGEARMCFALWTLYHGGVIPLMQSVTDQDRICPDQLRALVSMKNPEQITVWGLDSKARLCSALLSTTEGNITREKRSPLPYIWE